MRDFGLSISWKDHVRAVLIAVHLVLITGLAIEVPLVSPKDLKKPAIAAWITRTSEKLNDAGLSMSREEFQDQVVIWGGGLRTVLLAIRKPGNVYAKYAGVKQSWQMFAGVPTHSAYFFIEIDHGEGFEPLYTARSHEAAWRKPFFDHGRIRTFINHFVRKKNGKGWKRLSRYVRTTVGEAFPDAKRVRMGMQAVTFPPPEVLKETRAVELDERFWVNTQDLHPEPTEDKP